MTTFLISALAIIAALTSLTVEGIKKLIGDKYPYNAMAVVVALILTLIGSTMYIIYFGIPVTAQVIITVIVLTYLAFLVSTTSFDKIKQLLEQIGGKDGE